MSKRSASVDDDVDALVATLTTKLGAATTRDHDSLVALLCEVLSVDASMAAFYLDAAANDPHAAVTLHMQSAASTGSSSSRHHGQQKRSREDDELLGRYRQMSVTIAELPPGWRSRVSESGTIVFVHDESGHEQAQVPSNWGCAAPRGEATTAGGEAAGHDRDSQSMTDVPASPPSASTHPGPSSWQCAFPHVVCDACERQVAGTRYKCLSRENYDLCEKCMWSEAHAHLREGQRWIRMSFVGARE